MNLHAIQILFMKDLFLSRRYLFAYLAAGVASSVLTCLASGTLAFVGFILIITVAIAAGIHMIGTLLLSETTDQTRLFVMSMPISLLDYSLGKISVVMTTYLIPWSTMLAVCTIATFVIPSAKQGSVIILPAIFLFLLCGFMIQLVTAVVTESVGWTICVMVGCNVLLNVFLMKLHTMPEIEAAKQSELITWPPAILQLFAVEALVIGVALVAAFLFQTRKRDLI